MRTTPPWPGRAEPGDVADASSDPERHGLELLLEHVSWLRQVIAEEQLCEEPRTASKSSGRAARISIVAPSLSRA